MHFSVSVFFNMYALSDNQFNETNASKANQELHPFKTVILLRSYETKCKLQFYFFHYAKAILFIFSRKIIITHDEPFEA